VAGGRERSRASDGVPLSPPLASNLEVPPRRGTRPGTRAGISEEITSAMEWCSWTLTMRGRLVRAFE
jgi:hypothetical protein